MFEMIRILFTFLFLSIFTSYAPAQDMIYWISGDSVAVIVSEISPNEVRYKRFDNPNGPTYMDWRVSIRKIRYANGSEDIFRSIIGIDTTNTPMGISSASSKVIYSGANMKFMAISDARRNYQYYRGAATGTFFTSAVNPILGLIPGIICSSTPPSESNLGVDDRLKMENPVYNKSYKTEASRIKKTRVWGSWAMGLGVNIFLTFILLR
jgi:hypothetical protein